MIRRRRLPAPAAATVYELTDWGRELEPILLALGGWAMRVPVPEDASLSATSVLLFLRGAARPDPDAPPASYRLELGDHVWTVQAEGGRVHVQPGEPETPDATVRTDPRTLNALLESPAELDAAVARGAVGVEGDVAAVRRLLGGG